MALLCVGGTASTKKRFIAASSGAKVSVAEETDRLAHQDDHVYMTVNVKLYSSLAGALKA